MVRSTNTPSKQALLEALDRVMLIDLERIRCKTEHVLGWDVVRGIKAEMEYRRYLTLLLLYPDQQIAPPSDDADEIWHSHILDTMAYEKDCERLFGAFLHHVPSYGTPREKVSMAVAKEHTEALYERHFSKTRLRTERKTQSQGFFSLSPENGEGFWVDMAEKYDRAQQVASEALCVNGPTKREKTSEKSSEAPTRTIPVRKKEVVRGGDGCVPCLGSREKKSKTTKLVKIM